MQEIRNDCFRSKITTLRPAKIDKSEFRKITATYKNWGKFSFHLMVFTKCSLLTYERNFPNEGCFHYKLNKCDF